VQDVHCIIHFTKGVRLRVRVGVTVRVRVRKVKQVTIVNMNGSTHCNNKTSMVVN